MIAQRPIHRPRPILPLHPVARLRPCRPRVTFQQTIRIAILLAIPASGLLTPIGPAHGQDQSQANHNSAAQQNSANQENSNGQENSNRQENETGQENAATQYSDEVVAKAEKILVDNDLKRVGSQIQASNYTDVTRLLSDETKQSRSVRQCRTTCEEATAKLQRLEKQIEVLEIQLGQWNAQYAAVGNPQGRNNELVARINAGSAQLKQLIRLRDKVKEENDKLKATLGKAEEEYAEMVLKMRRYVDKMRETIVNANEVRDVGIALRVLATRYQCPTELDLDAMLTPLDRRVRKLEESIFSETIDLESEGGGLTVQAVIGLEPVNMLVDSGAGIVLIPVDLAEKLDLKAEPDAKELSLRTADGRRIAAKEIILPRLRVGKFEAENVKAALLEEAVAGAKPLLGMSFLERFKFEIDTQQKKLKLLEVDLPEK